MNSGLSTLDQLGIWYLFFKLAWFRLQGRLDRSTPFVPTISSRSDPVSMSVKKARPRLSAIYIGSVPIKFSLSTVGSASVLSELVFLLDIICSWKFCFCSISGKPAQFLFDIIWGSLNLSSNLVRTGSVPVECHSRPSRFRFGVIRVSLILGFPILSIPPVCGSIYLRNGPVLVGRHYSWSGFRVKLLETNLATDRTKLLEPHRCATMITTTFHPLHTLRTGYLLVSRGCVHQTRHDNSRVREGRTPGRFVILSGTKSTSRPVGAASHVHVYYPTN